MNRSGDKFAGAHPAFPSAAQTAAGGASPRSKTMRLDILPSAGEDAPATTRMPRAGNAADPGQLQLTPELLSHLYRHAYDAMLITDMDGIILSKNLRADDHLAAPGYPLAGRNILEIISGAEKDLLATLAETLSSVRFVRIHAWCRRHAEGFFPAEIAAHLVNAGKDRFLCFFLHDITWRKETEDKLQMAATAIGTTHAGIGVIALDGRLVFANSALNRLFGLAENDSLMDLPLGNLLAEHEAVPRMIEEVQTNKAWKGRVECLRAGGARVVAECEAVANFNSDGDIIGAVISFNDMTDQIRASSAERTIERDRVMMESLGTVCHHLGQPSTVLLNSIELMMRLDDGEREARSELLEHAKAAAERLCILLRELNDVRTYRTEPYLAGEKTIADKIFVIENDAL